MKLIETRPDGSIRVATVNNKPSKAQQQFKQMTDANDIIRRYKATGDASILAKRKGVYADLTGIAGYREALHKVMDAEAKFMSLPSELRKKFENDPQKLVEYLSDERNRKESIALGLRPADPVVESKEPAGPNPAGPVGQVPPVKPA